MNVCVPHKESAGAFTIWEALAHFQVGETILTMDTLIEAAAIRLADDEGEVEARLGSQIFLAIKQVVLGAARNMHELNFCLEENH